MKSRGDKPFEIVFHPERDEVLVCAELNRPVGCSHKHPHTGNCTAEGLAMPYDSSVQIMSLEQAQKHLGTWRVEVWAPNRLTARRLVHDQMRKRRGETLGETR